jgi:hypothetical protein
MENDRYVPLFLFLIAIVFIVYSFRYEIGSISNPGVSFFPLLCAAGLAVVALAQLWKSIRSASKKQNPQINQTPTEGTIYVRKAYAIIAVLVVFALLHSVLGFWLSVFIAMMALLRIAGVSNWKWSIFGGAATTIIGYLVFERWMGAYFPKGVIEAARFWLK